MDLKRKASEDRSNEFVKRKKMTDSRSVQGGPSSSGRTFCRLRCKKPENARKGPVESWNKKASPETTAAHEDKLQVDIDVEGNIFLRFAEVQPTTLPSSLLKTSLVAYKRTTNDVVSSGLVPYSDDECDEDSECDVGSPRDHLTQGTTLTAKPVFPRKCADNDSGAIDGECEPHSTHSRKDSGYWSGSARSMSSVFDTPRSVFEFDDHECTKEEKHETSKEKLDSLLPPLPTEPCSPQLQEKFNRLFALKKQGLCLTELIKRNHNFRNPSLLSNICKRIEGGRRLDLFGSNCETGVHFKSLWSEQSMYTALDQGGCSPEH